MALVRGRADLWIRSRTGSSLTGIGLCTGIAVVTDGSVRIYRIGTSTCGDIACARIMALIGGNADFWSRSLTSSILTSVYLSAGIAVIARIAIRIIDTNC